MSHTGYLVWIIGVAVATIVILAVGTLAAADLLPRRARRGGDAAEDTSTGSGEPGPEESVAVAAPGAATSGGTGTPAPPSTVA